MEKKTDFANKLWEELGKVDDSERLDARGNTKEEGSWVTESDLRNALLMVAAGDGDELIGALARSAIAFYNGKAGDMNVADAFNDAMFAIKARLK